MKIIALDLGSTMAMAHNGMDVPVIESWQEKGIRSHRICSTMRHLAVRFKQIKTACQIDLVVYERPFARGADATRSLWGLAGMVEAMATHNGWPVTDQVPMPIKKWATGNARASKDEMIAAARKMGYDPVNEHEADAICLLEYAKANAVSIPPKPAKRLVTK